MWRAAAIVGLLGCGRIGFDAVVPASSACLPADAGADAVGNASATTYHVATTGDDTRTCAAAMSAATPLQTIVHALGCLGAGDTLVVHGGVYAEEIDSEVVPIQGGTSWDTATHIVAAPGEMPIIRPPPGSGRVLSLVSLQASYLVFDGFVFDNQNGASAGNAAVKVSDGANTSEFSSHIRFVRSEIMNSPSAGFYANVGSDIQLIEVRVHDNGTVDPMDKDGIHLAVPNSLIERCDVYNNTGIGIELYDDIVAVSNTVVHYNTIHDNTSERGIYAGGAGATNDTIERNVVWNNSGGITVTADGSRVDHNTIVANAGSFGFCIETGAAAAVLADNICWKNPNGIVVSGGTAMQMANLMTDPMFVDEAAHDYDLQPGSPAINMGVVIAGMTYVGAPDIGAFEQPLATGAQIGCGGADVEVAVSAAFPPLRVPASCDGLTVSSLPLGECRADATTLYIGLVDKVPPGTTLSVDYSGGTVTDSLLVGNTSSARLAPFSQLLGP
jgi:hypothetical protein